MMMMMMNSDNIVIIGTVTLIGLALWFAGTSFRIYVATPNVCRPSVIKLTGENAINENRCSELSNALPPEKITDKDGKDIYIVRCVCDKSSKPVPSQ